MCIYIYVSPSPRMPSGAISMGVLPQARDFRPTRRCPRVPTAAGFSPRISSQITRDLIAESICEKHLGRSIYSINLCRMWFYNYDYDADV